MSLTRFLHTAFAAAHGGRGEVGPHDDREVELMRAGLKPVCTLTYPDELEKIQQLLTDVDDKKLFMLAIEQDEISDKYDEPHINYYFCQPANISDLQELIDLLETKRPLKSYEDRVEYSKKVGRILGYSDDDIDIFLRWNSSRALRTLTNVLALKEKLSNALRIEL